MQSKPIKKIFVCEFITGGGLCNENLPASLAKEGALMRDALLRDLSELPYEIITTMDARLKTAQPLQAKPDAACRLINANEDAWQVWQEMIASCDAVWAIAPETDDILLKFAELTISLGKIWLGCAPEAIELCGNKLKTAEFLLNNQIPTPTFTLQTFLDYEKQYPGVLFKNHHQYVCKPIFGAGCEHTYLFNTLETLTQFMRQHAQSHLIQLYLTGQPASMVVLCHKQKAHLLACNKQKIGIQNGQFLFKGVEVNGCAAHWAVFESLANFLAEKMPGLNGLVGVDVVFDDGLMRVIEINPRLTTSYVGLKQATGINPANLMLQAMQAEAFSMPNIAQNVVNIDV